MPDVVNFGALLHDTPRSQVAEFSFVNDFIMLEVIRTTNPVSGTFEYFTNALQK